MFDASRLFEAIGGFPATTPKRRPHSDTSAWSRENWWTSFESVLIRPLLVACSRKLRRFDEFQAIWHNLEAQTKEVETRTVGTGMRRQRAKQHEARMGFVWRSRCDSPRFNPCSTTSSARDRQQIRAAELGGEAGPSAGFPRVAFCPRSRDCRHTLARWDSALQSLTISTSFQSVRV